MSINASNNNLDWEKELIVWYVQEILNILWIGRVTDIALFRSAIHRKTGEIKKMGFFSVFHATMWFKDEEYERWYIIEWEGGDLFFSYQPISIDTPFSHKYNLTELDTVTRWKILPLMGKINEIESKRKANAWVTDSTYDQRVVDALEAR